MRRNVECLPVADQVLTAAERLDLLPVIADTLITKGSVLADTGRSYEGLSLIETGVRLAEQHGYLPHGPPRAAQPGLLPRRARSRSGPGRATAGPP